MFLWAFVISLGSQHFSGLLLLIVNYEKVEDRQVYLSSCYFSWLLLLIWVLFISLGSRHFSGLLLLIVSYKTVEARQVHLDSFYFSGLLLLIVNYNTVNDRHDSLWSLLIITKSLFSF